MVRLLWIVKYAVAGTVGGRQQIAVRIEAKGQQPSRCAARIVPRLARLPVQGIIRTVDLPPLLVGRKCLHLHFIG